MLLPYWIHVPGEPMLTRRRQCRKVISIPCPFSQELRILLCKDGLADQGSVKVILLCGSDLLESFSKPGVWIPDQSKEEVEPEEVLGRITAACARLVQGTRQALAPCPGGRVRGGAVAGAGSLLGTGDLAGRMPRCEWQQSAMAIVHGGDGTVVAVQAGDTVGGRRMCQAARSSSRA
ncbi:hypothetical protein ACQJBY_070538 [Aegilops geniculata]